jgi:hypothetical protein
LRDKNHLVLGPQQFQPDGDSEDSFGRVDLLDKIAAAQATLGDGFKLRSEFRPPFGKSGAGIPVTNSHPARFLAGIAEQQNRDVRRSQFRGGVQKARPKVPRRTGKLPERGQFLHRARKIRFHKIIQRSIWRRGRAGFFRRRCRKSP